MLGRSRLPVLAEVSGPPEGARAWSLRRHDLAALERLLPRLDDRRVVLVCGEGEAPSTAAIALASAASASGRRTILVECDLAHPRLAAQIGVAAVPGLQEYLRWEAEPADVLRPVVLAGQAAGAAAEPLVCVCAGRPASKAEALLRLQSFAHMVEKLRAAYELVILTGASPAVEPRLGLAAAQQVDAVIAALPAGVARSRAGRKDRQAVRRLPAPVLGSIAVGAA